MYRLPSFITITEGHSKTACVAAAGEESGQGETYEEECHQQAGD